MFWNQPTKPIKINPIAVGRPVVTTQGPKAAAVPRAALFSQLYDRATFWCLGVRPWERFRHGKTRSVVGFWGPDFVQLKKKGTIFFAKKFTTGVFGHEWWRVTRGIYIYHIISYYLGNLWKRNRTSPTKGSLVRKFWEKSRLMKECESSWKIIHFGVPLFLETPTYTEYI